MADLDVVDITRSVCSRARESGFDTCPQVAPIDYAFACAHGLLSHVLHQSGAGQIPSSQLILGYGGQSCTVKLSTGELLWSYGPVDDTTDEFDTGQFWQKSGGSLLSTTSARAVLIQVGHERLDLPLSLFVERIIVDDRPTRGGGLPDFWEATIARLIAQVQKDPNIAVLYLLGNHTYAARTIAELKDIGNWRKREDQICYKTGMPVQSVRSAAERLEGKIGFPESSEKLVAHLSEILRPAHDIKPISPLQGHQKGHAFLKREMRDDQFSLSLSHGCKVKTIAEAYPVVIEIVRQALEEHPICDQAGQELKELLDFKIHLSNPTEHMVPEFYAQEEATLEQYFQKEFLDENGLFGPRFMQFNQWDAVLSHLAKIVDDQERRFATRRAILVIPHEIKEGNDLAPLGLVSVRCIPRFLGQRIILHFSYSWRTVEAMVGLPYSMFGSVRFGQFLTNEIKKRVSKNVARQIEMGDVTYIAHSLHMFADEYGQNIAKRIVDDASI